jgi:iduronate 2-sulfatase
VETVDLYPTLRELAGFEEAKVPQTLDGKSLVPVLKEPSRENKEAVFHVYPRNRGNEGQILGRAVRTERYRMVEWKKPGAATDTADYELYDYKTDPGETKNLARGQPKIVRKLSALLAKQPEGKPQIGTVGKTQTKTKRETMFEERDVNRDGKLTHEEFMVKQPEAKSAEERFKKFDRNGDGVLSKDEFVFMGEAKK